jgi:hypothetical protein
MSNDRLMRRLAAAYAPVDTTYNGDRDELFAQIIAQPGDLGFAAGRPGTRAVSRHRRRAVVAGSLAGVGAAAAAAVIITGTGAHGRSDAAGVTIAGAHAQETAYVVRHLQANLRGDHWVTRFTGPGLGPGDTASGWTWTDPATGVQYARTTETDGTGQTVSVDWTASRQTGRRSDGQVVDRGPAVTIDYGHRTYSRASFRLTYTPGTEPAGLSSTPAQIAAALHGGTVTRIGTATVNGTAAVVLRIAGEQNLTLYVDAASDQPLRTVIGEGSTGSITTDLLPATGANVANARRPGIPAGFTRVKQVTLR